MDMKSFNSADLHSWKSISCGFWLWILLSLLLISCGGGGSESGPPSPLNPAPLTGGTPPDDGTPAPEPTSLTPLILPFDTTDNSVVLRSPLTSAASIQSAGGSEELTSANEFDATLGMKPGAMTTDGAPGARFSLNTIPALADMPSGQLSIEVEREWLAITNAETRSIGYVHGSQEHLLSYGTGALESAGKLSLQTDQKLLWLFRADEKSQSSSYVNTDRSSRFARITISWTTSTAELYVDGLRISSLSRTNPASDHLSTIHIGNLMGTGTAPFRGPYYIRNLIVSTRPVIVTTQPLLSHIMHIGDSFAAGQPYTNVASKYDGTIVNTVIKELISRGAGTDRISVFSNGGGQIQDNGTDPLELHAGQSLSRSDVLTQSPSLIVFITGGNDTSIFDRAQFTNDLHDHIEAFLGANGHPQTTTQHVIVTTTTSNLNANHPATLQMRQIMLELPAWWDSAYPSRAGAVSVIDTWSLFGGSQVDSTLFGIADPIHPAASGNIVYGKAIAEEIVRLVQNR